MALRRFALIISIGFFPGSNAALANDDHGNARSTATQVALPSAATGTIDPGNDTDWFRFEVRARGAVVLESSGDLDTLGTLFDARGSRIARDDDGAGYPNFRIERTLDAGAYYVRVHSAGRATGGYTLHLRGDDHGNSRASATRVTLPSATAGTIDPGNDADWFRFEVSATAAVELESSGDLDTLGTLFGARGNRIARDDDGAGYPNFRIERTLDAGAYYVRVHSAGSGTGGYTLHLRGDDGGHVAVTPGESFRDCDVCPMVVSVPAGSFLMGSPESEPGSFSDERSQRTVSVPAFAMGVFEVTFAEWDACRADGGCWDYHPSDARWGRGDRPVINVDWEQAQLYVEWLSRKTGQTYRLPTEAEWEYAARAGTTTPFNTGSTISPQQANFDGRYGYPDGYDEEGLYREQTVPVGSFAPNAFGLHDMHGNVWEHVEDCYGSYGDAPADGSASEVCVDRVVRGGSWRNGPAVLRSAHRAWNGGRNSDRGFRVVRTLASGAAGAPTVNDEIETQSLTLGSDGVLDLSGAFSDDQDLTYEVRSSNADVVRVGVSGSQLTLMPVAEGAATVTVTARDADGNRATTSFAVAVVGGGSARVPPGEGFRDCDVCPLMVSVPGGSFVMGAPESEFESRGHERPQRAVSVPEFAMGAYEVTFAEWDACVADRNLEVGRGRVSGCWGYRPYDRGWGRGDRPVINVHIYYAQRYAEWLSRKTGQTYRLPTEAEWEYAARAGTTTPFNTGATISSQQANFDGRYGYPEGNDEDGLYREQTVPVGSFTPNAFGLHDMHGNVSEWVEDCYGRYGRAPADGSASDFCTARVVLGQRLRLAFGVLRGGSWAARPWLLRSAVRVARNDRSFNEYSGFRVVRTPGSGVVGAPTVYNEIGRQSLTLGADSVLDLSGAFSDDQDLTYEVRSSNADVVRVGVSGSQLTLMPVAEGVATVTVTARDADGNEATMSFAVAVTDGGSAVPPGESFRDCGVCPLMVSVPAGSFVMGAPESEPHSDSSERPQRTVSVPAFAASAFEVTFAEWDACVATGGCDGYRPDDEYWGRGDRPVINVSWHDAQRYAEWLSRKTGQTYRLPTEAEWEYAARAGTTTPFNTGSTISPQQANFDGRYGYPDVHNGGGLYRGQTVPVGSFAPNAFGLHDMHGNVGEWVEDCFGYYGFGGNCFERGTRGGSWSHEPRHIRSASRWSEDIGERSSVFGLRVVRTLAR